MTKSRNNTIITVSYLAMAILAPAVAPGQIQMEHFASGDNAVITIRYFADELPAGVAGFDLQRRTVMECGSETILTVMPWTPANGGTDSFEYTDTAVTPNILYEYDTIPVDAERRPLEICEVFDCEGDLYPLCMATTYASRGAAAFADAILLDLGWALMFTDACPSSCGLASGIITFWLPEVAGYANTDQVVRLSGTVGWEPGGMEGCLYAQAYTAVPVECAVANEQMRWGTLKAIYR